MTLRPYLQMNRTILKFGWKAEFVDIDDIDAVKKALALPKVKVSIAGLKVQQSGWTALNSPACLSGSVLRKSGEPRSRCFRSEGHC